MSQIEQIVLLIHGIRTQANWQPMVVKMLEEQDEIKVIPLKYGYLDVFRFWLPFTRQKPIDFIENQLRVARKKYPHAKISVIAHSFGSYIIGNLLEKQVDLELDKLILCGSVLPRSYEWDKVIHKFIDRDNENIINIINECGKRDIWPVLATSMSWGYGPSGTHGFGHVHVKDRYHNTDHGGYFNPNFVTTYWKPFIEKGKYISNPEPIISPPWPLSWLLSILELLPLRWFLVAGMIGVLLIAPIQRCIDLKPPVKVKVKTISITEENKGKELWYVIVGSFLTREDAVKQAEEARLKEFAATVYLPHTGGKKYYPVVIGVPSSYQEAKKLCQKAIDAGFPKDTYLWTSFLALGEEKFRREICRHSI